MVKIKNVEITNPELDAVEDLIVAWTLCKKHTCQTTGKSQVEIYKMQYSCKQCQKEVNKIKNRSLHLWKKLVHAYETARYGKCGGCEK